MASAPHRIDVHLRITPDRYAAVLDEAARACVERGDALGLWPAHVRRLESV